MNRSSCLLPHGDFWEDSLHEVKGRVPGGTPDRGVVASATHTFRRGTFLCAMIDVEGFPQLAFLLWNRESRQVTEAEALALYEANRQWVDPANMVTEERRFFEELVARHGRGIFLG